VFWLAEDWQSSDKWFQGFPVLWYKRCKDEKLRGTVKEVVHQISHSKKWKSDIPLTDEKGNPLLRKNGKPMFRASYSILQDELFNYMTEGDFLRHLLVCQTTDLKVQEGYRLGSIVRRDFCPALQIDADSEQVVTSMLNQNFVPIVDGRNALCGILTRKRLIEFLAQARDKKE